MMKAKLSIEFLPEQLMKSQLRNQSRKLHQKSLCPPVDRYYKMWNLYLVIKPQSSLLSIHDISSQKNNKSGNLLRTHEEK